MAHVGFGVGDITPKVGMEMPGGFQPRYGKGIREPLIASACVVFDGERAVALVGVDTVAIDKRTVTQAREQIAARTKIPAAHVLVGSNHTHSGGPSVTMAGDPVDPAYDAILVRGITEAVTTAWNALHEAEIGVGTGRAEGIAFNRRFLMRDGREITHPGKPGTPHHDQIVRPAGPVDPDVGVLAAKGPDGSILGVVVHFTCHSTVVGGDQFSPDYAGYLRKHLKARYGEALPVVFLLGACGDITQVNNLAPGSEFGPEYADTMGQTLAAEAIRTIGRMTWDQAPTVAVATETVPCAIRPEPDPEAEKPPYGLGSAWDEEFARERQHVAEERKRTPVIPCEVQGIRVGPLGIATNGSEYFCEFGLRIKDCSPLKPTWVVSLANEYIGYVPTAHAFLAGGYEPRTARSSKLAPDAGQKLLVAALAALNKVAP
jgi:neutral ceramidase